MPMIWLKSLADQNAAEEAANAAQYLKEEVYHMSDQDTGYMSLRRSLNKTPHVSREPHFRDLPGGWRSFRRSRYLAQAVLKGLIPETDKTKRCFCAGSMLVRQKLQ